MRSSHTVHYTVVCCFLVCAWKTNSSILCMWHFCALLLLLLPFFSLYSPVHFSIFSIRRKTTAHSSPTSYKKGSQIRWFKRKNALRSMPHKEYMNCTEKNEIVEQQLWNGVHTLHPVWWIYAKERPKSVVFFHRAYFLELSVCCRYSRVYYKFVLFFFLNVIAI